jgi:sugar lactone lactonase YvrE
VDQYKYLGRERTTGMVDTGARSAGEANETERDTGGATRDESGAERGWRRRSVLGALGAGTVFPLLGGVAAAHGGQTGDVETVADFTEPNEPENLTIDDDGRKYLTMAQTGEIRVLPANETFAVLPSGGGFLTGIVADDDRDVLYAALASYNTPGSFTHGLWRVLADGTTELVTPLPPDTFLNGLLMEDGRLLVTDSTAGTIYTVSPTGEFSVWLQDPLLAPPPGGTLGANGLALEDGLFVANTDAGRIVRVPIEPDGSAGEPTVFVEDGALEGADGIVFDGQDHLYVAVNRQDTLVHVDTDRALTTLATDTDGLDFPSDVAFGTTGTEQQELFVTNFAFGSTDVPRDPALLKLRVDATGDVE